MVMLVGPDNHPIRSNILCSEHSGCIHDIQNLKEKSDNMRKRLDKVESRLGAILLSVIGTLIAACFNLMFMLFNRLHGG